jgi:uncharacterized damage-inducible protein DinB
MLKGIAVCMLAAAPMLLATENGQMNDAERAFLIEQLEKSKAEFLESISAITEAQWKFKPSPQAWSVAECAEHIIVAEEFLLNATQGLMKSPAVDRPGSSTAEQDKKIAMMIRDRSHKAKAPEPLVPSGKFATPADAAKEFTARREKSLEYARTTNDELRVHTTQGPVGTMDAYQLLILMAVHTGRHTDQIKEVQANPDYPKATAALVSR